MSGTAFKLPTLAEATVEALMTAASMAYQAGKFENALKIYKGISVARPSWSRPHVGLGASLYSLGRAAEAEAEYRSALELDERDQEAHLYLGELIWNERQDSGAAESHLATAFRIQPQNRFGERARFIISAIKSKK